MVFGLVKGLLDNPLAKAATSFVPGLGAATSAFQGITDALGKGGASVGTASAGALGDALANGGGNLANPVAGGAGGAASTFAETTAKAEETLAAQLEFQEKADQRTAIRGAKERESADNRAAVSSANTAFIQDADEKRNFARRVTQVGGPGN